jgi:hypothetical protein
MYLVILIIFFTTYPPLLNVINRLPTTETTTTPQITHLLTEHCPQTSCCDKYISSSLGELASSSRVPSDKSPINISPGLPELQMINGFRDACSVIGLIESVSLVNNGRLPIFQSKMSPLMLLIFSIMKLKPSTIDRYFAFL